MILTMVNGVYKPIYNWGAYIVDNIVELFSSDMACNKQCHSAGGMTSLVAENGVHKV